LFPVLVIVALLANNGLRLLVPSAYVANTATVVASMADVNSNGNPAAEDVKKTTTRDSVPSSETASKYHQS
jgi:hypothetical protein